MVKEDLAGVAVIEGETLSPWSVESLSQELEIQQAYQFVAEAPDAQIIGWCACRVIWPEAELLKIAVKIENRERGVGRFLFKHLFDELQKRKVTCLFLEVRLGNRIALDFYERHGFVQVGTRPGYYSDPPDSAMILKKNLS
jgi:ribosomal-protein-alanine N-acetyltransferase